MRRKVAKNRSALGLLVDVATGHLAASAAHPPRLVGAINRNALAFFLLANAMTGAVNFGLDTIAAERVSFFFSKSQSVPTANARGRVST